MYMHANATNFQYNSIFDQFGYMIQHLINQTIIKQHSHQSISELEFQIHNFDIYIYI